VKINFQQAIGCDVLLVAYGGGHVQMLLPVARILKAQGKKVVFLALTTARSVLESNEIDFITYADFPFQSDVAKAHGVRLAAELPSNSSVPQADTAAYLGMNYESIEKKHGAAAAADLYANQGRTCFHPVDIFLKLLEQLAPRVVVATNSPRSERAAIEAAGLLSIPSVCVIDLFALREIEWIGQSGFASALCVLNAVVKTLFVQHGRSAEQVHVTGNPAFDPLFEPALEQAGQNLRIQHGWNDDPLLTVLWASQVEPEVHPFDPALKSDPQKPELVEKTLRQATASNPDIRLVVRYHPSQQCEFLPQARVCSSPPDENISALLHAVDVVVTMTSTVGLQAHLLGKPVLTFDDSVFYEDMPYSRMGISSGFNTLQSLQRHVETLSRQELRATRIPKSSREQGLATQKICALIGGFL